MKDGGETIKQAYSSLIKIPQVVLLEISLQANLWNFPLHHSGSLQKQRVKCAR